MIIKTIRRADKSERKEIPKELFFKKAEHYKVLKAIEQARRRRDNCKSSIELEEEKRYKV